MQFNNIICCSVKLFSCISEIFIFMVFPNHWLVCRYFNNPLVIYLKQFVLCIHECTAHAGHLVKQHEQILEGNRCHSSVFLRYLYLFLCLYSLMLTATQLYTMHETSCCSVKQLYLSIRADYIIFFIFEQFMSSQCQRNMPVDFKIFLTIKVRNTKKALCKFNPLWSEPDSLVLFNIVNILNQCRNKEITQIIKI